MARFSLEVLSRYCLPTYLLNHAHSTCGTGKRKIPKPPPPQEKEQDESGDNRISFPRFLKSHRQSLVPFLSNPICGCRSMKCFLAPLIFLKALRFLPVPNPRGSFWEH